MPSPSIYLMGTVAVTAGSAVVTGTGTGWLANAVTGGMFSLAGMSIPIASVENDTHLTLGYEWPGATATGLAYAISRESAAAADATYVHNALVNVLRTLAISAVEPDGAGTLAERDAVTPVPAEKYIWLHVETGYPLELFIRSGVSTWLGPFPWRGEQGAPGIGTGGYGLPLGGTAGQALIKSSGVDGASSWQIIVNSVAGIAGAVTAAALKTALGISAYAETLLAAANAGAAQTVLGISTFVKTILDDADAAAVCATIGAVKKSGDTMTGALIVPSISSRSSGNYGQIEARSSPGNTCSLLSEHVPGVGYNGIIQVTAPGGTPLSNAYFGTSGSLSISGALSKGSGTFLIDHPLDPLNRNLRHGFVEAPRYDLIYRGVATLVDGVALIDIDAASDMTAGTFAALTTNAVVTSLQNQDGFAALKPGAITGGTFEIVCEDACNDNVSWVVIAERNDAFVKSESDHNCDADGRFIPEFEKEVA